MKIKKIMACALAGLMAISAVSLTGCGSQDEASVKEQISKDIESKFSAYETDYKDSAPYKTNAALKRYITRWASAKKVSYKVEGDNIIMKKSASKGYSKADPTVVICPYDADQQSTFSDAMTLCFYLIKSKEKTGALTVVFTPESNHDFSGIKTVSKKYFTDKTKVIALNGAAAGNFAVNTGGAETFRFSAKAKYKKPTYKKAYKISITNMPGGQLTTGIGRSDNPVLRLQGLLETLQKKHIEFEIASFKGGKAGQMTPTSAEVIITVDENKEEAYQNVIDSAVESFNDSMKDTAPDAKLVSETTKRPSKVMTKTSANRLISFMYTALEGKYHSQNDTEDSDDDQVAAKAYVNLTQISTGKKTVINTVAYATVPALLTEIEKDEKTLAYLSGISFKKTSMVPIWNGETSEDFQKAISGSYESYTGKSMQYADSLTPTNANYIRRLNDKTDVISLTVSDNIVKDCAGSIMTYLTSLSDENTENKK
ncbi:MAG: hypothetical protein PUB39_00170 [Eubacteriales bacterium]|nr:hypothetical protein [Eubacteriales bacterium]